MSALIQMDNIHLTFGGRPLLDGAGMIVEAGDRIALVGRNGSGKSTFLKIVAGMIEAQDGTVFRQPSATIRYLPQEPDFADFETVEAYVEAGLGPADEPYRVVMLIEALGLDGAARPQSLSGGEARRAALARVLAPEPDLLLLDEPTNHLDLPTIEWLESELGRIKSAIVLISHDRRFLEKVSRKTLWLDRGQTRLLDKGFGSFEAWRDTVLEQEELEAHKLARKIVREEDWLRYGVSARRTRNMRRLGELHAMRKQYRERDRAVGKAKIEVSDVNETGKKVIEAFNLSKSYGDRAIVRDFSIRIHRGDRIGFAGANGAGKTTLLKLLTGDLDPDSGSLKTGANLEIGRFDQKRESLDPEESLSDYLTEGRGESLVVNGSQRHVTAYMKDFLFRPEQARTPISALSGGEQARLILARVFSKPANLLILDEPTNDLDIETLDLLEETIASFPGTVLLVSHDRDFLDRTVTSLIVAEGVGRFTTYAGGWSDMIAQRGGSPFSLATRTSETPKAAKPALSEPVPATKTAPRRKLSFKQSHALATLPAEIAALETEIAKIEAGLADPAFYTRDPAGFAKASARLEAARREREDKENEWLELEMLREELEG